MPCEFQSAKASADLRLSTPIDAAPVDVCGGILLAVSLLHEKEAGDGDEAAEWVEQAFRAESG